MALRNAIPLRFSPAGLSDTLDSTDNFPGAMASLANLIPDPTTKNLWQCRPAAISKGNTTGNKFVSAAIVVGDRVYGMVGSNVNAGKDEPFCFNITGSALVSITGITNANSPTQLATTGDWIPPSMDLVGTKIVVAHQGFVGTSNFIGWIDISNPAALTWTAGNVATNPFATVPTAVKQYGNRAWYALNPTTGAPTLVYSDVLVPTTVTLSSQALQFGDNLPLTALGALPLNNQSGGIIQSLIVFKGASNMYQITGDPAITNSLNNNAMSVATGTLAPNSIATTPKGLAFMSPDGIRYIDFQGNISDPIGVAGDGVSVPFINALIPSRACAACNASVYRISVQNDAAVGNANQEYWFDIPRKVWTGPHTFPYSQIKPYKSSFVGFPLAVTGGIFTSDVAARHASVYVENGATLQWVFQTALLPDPSQMAEMAMVETTINVTKSAGVVINILALDQGGSALGTYILPASAAASFWGTMVWGVSLWQGVALALAPRPIKWPAPIEFRRLAIYATGLSGAGLQIGDVFMRYQILRYLQEPVS